MQSLRIGFWFGPHFCRLLDNSDIPGLGIGGGGRAGLGAVDMITDCVNSKGNEY